MVSLEIVYSAAADECIIHLNLSVPEKSTVAEVLQRSGIYETHPETKMMSIGIFGKQVPMDKIVKSGDRIEIYRPLTIDPMEKRRQRAGKK